MVSSGISDDDQSRLHESLLNLIRECSGSKSTSDGVCSCVFGELQNCSLSEGSSTDDNDVLGVIDGGNDSCCQDDLFPGLLKIDEVDTVSSSLPDVWFH